MTPATVSERNSIAYQGGRLRYLQRRACELRAEGVTYRKLRDMFGVSTATLCKWVRTHRQRLTN